MLYSPAPKALKPADDHGAFQRSDNPTDQRAEHHEGTDAWDNEESRPKQQTPKAAPKGPQLAPDLHAVTGIVVADDVLFGVIVLAHNGHFFMSNPDRWSSLILASA